MKKSKANKKGGAGGEEPVLIRSLFGDEQSDDIMGKLEEEIKFHTVHHKGGEVPRLLCIQGHIEKGEKSSLIPVYRHPMDDEPVLVEFTPTVLRIKKRVEEALGVKYEFNHVLIQKYRDGDDFIGEHSDKTIDIQKGTVITNYSLGAQRSMTMRSKRRGPDNQYEKLQYDMPHDSLFVLALDQNRKYRHAVNQEAKQRKPGNVRISFTFRRIATYFCTKKKVLVGQGAPAKTNTSTTMKAEKKRLLQAFHDENNDPDFDWEKNYGGGSCAYFVDYVERYKNL